MYFGKDRIAQSSVCNRRQRFTQHLKMTAFAVKVDEFVLIYEAIVSSGISVHIYQMTQHHIPKDCYTVIFRVTYSILHSLVIIPLWHYSSLIFGPCKYTFSTHPPIWDIPGGFSPQKEAEKLCWLLITRVTELRIGAAILTESDEPRWHGA